MSNANDQLSRDTYAQLGRVAALRVAQKGTEGINSLPVVYPDFAACRGS